MSVDFQLSTGVRRHIVGDRGCNGSSPTSWWHLYRIIRGITPGLVVFVVPMYIIGCLLVATKDGDFKLNTV